MCGDGIDLHELGCEVQREPTRHIFRGQQRRPLNLFARMSRAEIDDELPKLLALLVECHPHFATDPTALADKFECLGDEAVAPPRSKLALSHACKFARDAHLKMFEVITFGQ